MRLHLVVIQWKQSQRMELLIWSDLELQKVIFHFLDFFSATLENSKKSRWLFFIRWLVRLRHEEKIDQSELILQSLKFHRSCQTQKSHGQRV